VRYGITDASSSLFFRSVPRRTRRAFPLAPGWSSQRLFRAPFAAEAVRGCCGSHPRIAFCGVAPAPARGKLEIAGFRDVVVSTGVDALDHRILLFEGRMHDQGNVAPAAVPLMRRQVSCQKGPASPDPRVCSHRWTASNSSASSPERAGITSYPSSRSATALHEDR